MESFFGLSAASRKHFNETVEQAERKFRQATNAVDGTNNILGIDTRSIWEREKIRVPATKEAALEYLGTILFFLIDKFSLLRLPDDELQSRVNVALAGLRRITFKEKWPKSIPLSPGWHEREEQEFDAALIQWLENREEWRRYEAQVLPQIADATAADDSGQRASSPLVYCNVWPLEGLSVMARSRIRAGLLEIHGAFLDDKTNGEVDCWRRVYDLVADEFDRAGKLTDDLVNTRIPEIVADAAAGGAWSYEPSGRVQPTSLFNVRLGTRFYTSWRVEALLDGLRGRTTYWRGHLILSPATSSASKADSIRRGRKAKFEDHQRVATMVASLEGDWKSPTNLKRLAEWMDSEHLEVDRRWRNNRIYTWVEKLDFEDDNFVKAIEYRLGQTKK